MPPRKINLVEAADRKIAKVFDPHIAGDVNDSQVKIAKFGEVFDWHAHEHEDEAFLVLRGRIAIDFRDGAVELGEGEFIVVPKAVESAAFAERGAGGADVRAGDDAEYRECAERADRYGFEAAVANERRRRPAIVARAAAPAGAGQRVAGRGERRRCSSARPLRRLA